MANALTVSDASRLLAALNLEVAAEIQKPAFPDLYPHFESYKKIIYELSEDSKIAFSISIVGNSAFSFSWSWAQRSILRREGSFGSFSWH